MTFLIVIQESMLRLQQPFPFTTSHKTTLRFGCKSTQKSYQCFDYNLLNLDTMSRISLPELDTMVSRRRGNVDISVSSRFHFPYDNSTLVTIFRKRKVKDMDVIDPPTHDCAIVSIYLVCCTFTHTFTCNNVTQTVSTKDI